MIFFCSVSDLLDFISPNQDSRGRDAEAAKRRNLGIKVINEGFSFKIIIQNVKWPVMVVNFHILFFISTHIGN